MTTAQPEKRQRRSLRERLFGNPMVAKELRGRMRGARAFIVLSVYLALMSGFVTLIYVVFRNSSTITGPSQGGEIGRVLFWSIVGVELFLVTFIAPAFAAGSISGERERQTYDLLRTTLLPARSLIMGKLFATLSYIFLLLIAALPLQSIAFLFGGVAETELILSFVVLVTTALLLGTVGVFFSAITKRTLTASVLSYAFALMTIVIIPVAILVLVPLSGFFFGSLGSAMSDSLQAILMYIGNLLVALNPMATLFGSLMLLTEQQAVTTFPITLDGGSVIYLVSPWIPYVISTLFFAFILMTIAIRRVSRIEDA